jgi:hypothetical protein
VLTITLHVYAAVADTTAHKTPGDTSRQNAAAYEKANGRHGLAIRETDWHTHHTTNTGTLIDIIWH